MARSISAISAESTAPKWRSNLERATPLIPRQIAPLG